MGEGGAERPSDGDQREQDEQEHQCDEASCPGLLFGGGAGDSEGVDEGVDDEAERIHKL